jgi:hypothetical protein
MEQVAGLRTFRCGHGNVARFRLGTRDAAEFVK